MVAGLLVSSLGLVCMEFYRQFSYKEVPVLATNKLKVFIGRK